MLAAVARPSLCSINNTIPYCFWNQFSNWVMTELSFPDLSSSPKKTFTPAKAPCSSSGRKKRTPQGSLPIVRSKRKHNKNNSHHSRASSVHCPLLPMLYPVFPGFLVFPAVLSVSRASCLMLLPSGDWFCSPLDPIMNLACVCAGEATGESISGRRSGVIN
jgi:hypothetical protein